MRNPKVMIELVYILIKVAVLQGIFWWISQRGYRSSSLVLSVGITGVMLVNYYLIRKMIHFKHYTLIALIFLVSGHIHNSLLVVSSKMILEKDQTSTFWMTTLWLLFFCYYGDVLKRMLNWNWKVCAILGCMGGVLATKRALLNKDILLSWDYYFWVGIVWAFFVPFTLHLFKSLKKN